MLNEQVQSELQALHVISMIFMNKKFRNARNAIPAITLIVSLLLVAFFRGVPLLTVVVKSFFSNSLDSSNRFIGISNFVSVVQDKVVWDAIGNSIFLLMYIPFLLFLSLIISVLIYDGIKFSIIYKIIIVFPQVVSTLIIAAIFSGLFGFNGVVNYLLSVFNVEPVYWLGSRVSAFFVIILCVIYTMFGWQTLIFTGSLSSVDPNLRALTLIDGLGLWKKMLIYAQTIKNTIVYSVVLNVIYGFAGFFPIIFTLTKGGPGYSTTTIDYLIYIRAFKYGKEMSSAFTIATLLLIIVIIFVLMLYSIIEKVGGEKR